MCPPLSSVCKRSHFDGFPCIPPSLPNTIVLIERLPGQHKVLWWFWFLYDFTVRNIIGSWTDKFLDIFFKKTKEFDFSKVMVKTVPLDNSWGELFKKIFKKIMFACFFLKKRALISAFLVVQEECLNRN